jgi:hypothetical protein
MSFVLYDMEMFPVISLLICDSRYVTQGNIGDNELREENFCQTVAKISST